MLRADIIAHAKLRWDDLRAGLIERAIETHDRSAIFEAFPTIKDDPALLGRLTASLADGRHHYPSLDELLADIAPATIEQARLLIEALAVRRSSDNRGATELATPIFAAIGRGLAWAPWAVLQAILRARPDYAKSRPIFEDSRDPNRESQTAFNARLELASNIEPQAKVRAVAAMLLELLENNAGWNSDGLLARPAEVRAAYVDTLKEAIGDDAALRRAVIEVLLWSAEGRAADLAQFAAVALAAPEDRAALIALEQHHVQLVRYSARAVRAAKFGERLAVPALSGSGGLIQSVAALEGEVAQADESARTWLGDRGAERLIEATIAREEARFAREYADHGDEGEDRLVASLFAALALRFGDLDDALEAFARASSAPYRASVQMRYRNVDRPEEGAKGIKDAKSFSADLCLIVDPIRDGASLGRRVTLIQAKRLYRDHGAAVQPAWDASFQIKPQQVEALLKQTHSSVYFFHGPPLAGRGVPVIPTQLVADLSRHQASGSTLARSTVGVASRSLADWLTYDALALRTGDPYQDLVARAEGRPGSLPRPLLDLPTVEVDIALSPRSEDR